MWNCTMIKCMYRWLKPGTFSSLGLGMRLIHWVKGTMFYFSHMLFMSHGLDPLVFCTWWQDVRWSMWVEDFDIEVSPYETVTPKAIGSNISLCMMLSLVSANTVQHLQI